MRPRRESRAMAKARWQQAMLGVLVVSSLLYTGFIVRWTLQSPDMMKNGVSASILQQKSAVPGSDKVADAINSTAYDDNLLRGSTQQLIVESTQENVATTNEGDVKDLPSNSSLIRRLKCLGWRATAECSPYGSRLPQNDQDCNSTIPDGTSGYCEVEDKDSNEKFMVMKRTCDRGYKGAVFRCVDAPGFANFRVEAQHVVDKALEPEYKLPNLADNPKSPSQGIVMVVYPKMAASVYATVRALRDVLGCKLPIEIWLRRDEMNKAPEALQPLWDLERNKSAGKITFQEIRHQQAFQFNSKVYAVYNSKFEHVLFLDADNVPVRDPTYLFKTPEFVKTGAVFWPDYWNPAQTIFSINQTSLVWQLIDMPYVDMFEQESGQLLIDRRRHAAPLGLVMFYAFHLPNYFNRLKLAWGDKDLFRFAWLKLKAPFHMIEKLPAIAGEKTEMWFCGMTMVQHDPSGNVIFLHRNQLKLTGDSNRESFDPRLKKALGYNTQPLVPDDGYPDPAIWTHLVSFRESSPLSEYIIKKHVVMNKFTGLQRCFGGRELHTNPHFHTQDFADLNFAGLESHLRQFAMIGAQLQEKKRHLTT